MTITALVSQTALGVFTNTVQVGSDTVDANPDNNTAEEGTEIIGADLLVSKYDWSDPAGAGEYLTYTVEIFNQGPDVAANVVMTDVFPAEFLPIQADSNGSYNFV